jgi:hypothetical protein
MLIECLLFFLSFLPSSSNLAFRRCRTLSSGEVSARGGEEKRGEEAEGSGLEDLDQFRPSKLTCRFAVMCTMDQLMRWAVSAPDGIKHVFARFEILVSNLTFCVLSVACSATFSLTFASFVGRIDDLEKSIGELMAQAGIEEEADKAAAAKTSAAPAE